MGYRFGLGISGKSGLQGSGRRRKKRGSAYGFLWCQHLDCNKFYQNLLQGTKSPIFFDACINLETSVILSEIFTALTTEIL